MLVLLAFTVIISFFSLYVAIKVSIDLDTFPKSHVSSGEVNLTVESAPGGTVCGDGVCNGTETVSSCAADCAVSPSVAGPSGGGGGGSPTYRPAGPADFEVRPTEISFDMVQGEIGSREIIVNNTGKRTLQIDIESVGLSGIARMDKVRSILGPGKFESLFLIVLEPNLGIYPGKLIFKGSSITKEILVLINVISKNILFDVSLTIPKKFKEVRMGGTVPTFIELNEIGGESGIDVEVEYIIKDFEGNTISSETEVMYVFGTEGFSKDFETFGLKPGDYVAGIELTYEGGKVSSS